MKRHNSRIMTVQYLFAWDFNQYQVEELDIHFQELKQTFEEDQSIDNDWNVDFPFAYKLIQGSISNLGIIDEIITNNLSKWTIDRLSFVDRAILRLATYEMKFTKTASQVIINEAIEITKEYSSLDNIDQVKFNNKVLDQIAKAIYG